MKIKSDMKRKTPPNRPRSQTDIRLSPEDRPTTGGKTGPKPARKSSRKPAGKSGTGKGTAKARKANPGRKTQKGKRKGTSSLSGRLFRIGRELVYWCVIAGIWCTIGIAGILIYYGWQLPQSSEWNIPDRPPNIQIVSVDGALIANRGETGGQEVRISTLPPYLPDAVVAIEDRRFYHHFGFDPIGFTRAIVTNLVRRRLSQGGSTLTQQLAKNLFFHHERTLKRKVQELILALWLETKYSKSEILEMYLNRVYLGSGATGVDAAARTYYNKPASMLTLSEAATIAGLLKAPSRLAPNKNPKGAQARAKLVLAAMERAGFITAQERKLALTMPVHTVARHKASSLNYVADWVMEQLPDYVSDVKQDIIVETSLDLRLQNLAETAIDNAISDQGTKYGVDQSALVSMTPLGAVKAMIGGRSYQESQYNRAVKAKRQPGSAFKPFVYLASLELGNKPDSQRIDEPITYGKWSPKNYSKKYIGQISLRKALALSINTVAAQLTFEVGPDQVIKVAHAMGIKSDLVNHLSIALGTSEVTPLELVDAYLPFANGGQQIDPYIIKRIVTKEGKVLYQHNNEPGTKVIDATTLSLINSMMQETLISGTGKKAMLPGRPAGGKTGTTQNYRDAWFVGYTANLVTGIWFGNDDGHPTKRASGGNLPAETWKAYMVPAHNGMNIASLPGLSPQDVARMRNAAGGEAKPWINPDLLPHDEQKKTQPLPRERRGFFGRLFGG